MKAKRITLKNVMGISELDVAPGQITLVKGKNETGKTSFMSAIASIVSGGHDAYLIRNGEKEGEAVIEFDEGVTVSKFFSKEKSSVSVEIEERKLSSPATYIKDLFGTGFNPVAFLTMPDKDRAGEILKNIPLQLNRDVIDPIVNQFNIEGVSFDQHPLKVLDSINKALYDSRTGYNRLVKDAQSTKETLRKSIVEVDPSALTSKANMEQEKAAVLALIAEADKKCDSEISILTQELSNEIEKLHKLYSDKKDKARLKSSNTKQEHNAKLNELTASIATIDEQVKLAERQEHVKTQINEAEAKIQKNSKIVLGLESAMHKIASHKEELTESVSIAGHKISIVDGALFIDDLPFGKLNTATRVRIAMAIAEMNMGKARFAVIDGAECLDNDNLAAIASEAKARDMQLLMFAVSSDDKQLSFHNIEPLEQEEIF